VILGARVGSGFYSLFLHCLRVEMPSRCKRVFPREKKCLLDIPQSVLHIHICIYIFPTPALRGTQFPDPTLHFSSQSFSISKISFLSATLVLQPLNLKSVWQQEPPDISVHPHDIKMQSITVIFSS
jgi:hypothetical protein